MMAQLKGPRDRHGAGEGLLPLAGCLNGREAVSTEATPEILARIANGLYHVRQLLEWSGHLRAPDDRGKKPAPLVKLNAGALPWLQAANEEIRAALAMLGEEPGWSAAHADAILLRHRGYADASKFAASPAVAPAEAMDRIAQLEAEVKQLKEDLKSARSRLRLPLGPAAPCVHLVPVVPRSELDAALARALAAEGKAEEAESVDDALDEAAHVTGSGDPWRELGRLQEFCMRITFAGTVPNPFAPGATIGPIVADDRDLPVFSWVRAEGRAVPHTIAEAARLYVAWQREACALFSERLKAGPALGRKEAT